MTNSMFFLPCICIIICFIISAITYTYNKAKDRAVDKDINDDIQDRAVDKAIDDDIQDSFVCLGDVYIDRYSIESIYLDDNGHLVDIKTDRNQYSYRFTSESSYHKYLDYLEDTCKINTMIHNQY